MGALTELDRAFVAKTYARFPVELIRGEGSKVYDADGKEYIDMGSGIGVTAFGIADAEWKAAVSAQLEKLQHVSNLYYTELLKDILRDRFGFKGYVESDANGVEYLNKYHKTTKNATESAALAAKSGCDLCIGDAYRELPKA